MRQAQHHLEFFETMHAEPAEPFRYSERGAEIVRHDKLLDLIERWQPTRLLEIGCSAGFFTERLAGLKSALFSIDLSPNAVMRARPRASDAKWTAASVLELPFRAGSFDVVVAADGPTSWYLDDAERQVAYHEIRRVLREGGHALITEYLRPRRFDSFVHEIAAAGLDVRQVSYLYDRPWYQLERWLAHFPNGLSAPIIRSRMVARCVALLARPIGRRAAHHIFVAARGTAHLSR